MIDEAFDPDSMLDATGKRRVDIRGLPVAAVLRVDGYLAALVREVNVIRLDGRPVERSMRALDAISALLADFGEQQLMVRRLCEEAFDAGEERFDVCMEVPHRAAEAASLMEQAIDEIQVLSRGYMLLIPPLEPAPLEFFSWFLQEIGGQVRGSRPSGGIYKGSAPVSSLPDTRAKKMSSEASALDDVRSARCSFDGKLTNALVGRRFVVATLEGWALRTEAERAQLPVAELLSNALMHTHGDITLTVLGDSKHVRVEVRDDGPGEPNVRRREHHEGVGRGLLLVDSYVDRWGYESEDGGKTVWFELDL